MPLKKGLPPLLGGAARPPASFDQTRRAPLRPRGAQSTEPDVRHVLALRVDFEDQPMDSSAAYFDRLLFFLDQYYDQVSAGRTRFESTLLPTVYRLPRPMAWYGMDDSVGTNQAVFGYDAVKAADPDVDFSRYDHVIIFHGGAGQESDVKDDSRGQIWSASFRLVDFAYYDPWPGAEKGIPTADRTASGDSVYVTSVGMFPETESQDGYVFGCMGVICHEMGHSLGLPDLYDTVAPEGKVLVESQGVGNWDLMASGTWNNNGFVPGEPSAWSKVFLGWVDPVVVTAESTELSLKAVELDRRRGVVKIPLNADEYFLIENRFQDINGDGLFNYRVADSLKTCRRAGPDSTPACKFDYYHDDYTGAEWDFFLPGDGKGSGLLIWHIDESVISQALDFNTVNADPLHKGVDLEEADGIQDLDTQAGDLEGFGSQWDAFRTGWVDRFGPDTEPNSDGYYGIPSYITISGISAADTTMTFHVAIGGADRNWPVLTAGPIGGNHVAVAELDGDAGLETAVADRAGNLYVLNADGSPAWAGGTGGAFANLGTPVGSPLLADVNGDGRTDLLVMADDGRVFGFRDSLGVGRPLGLAGNGLLLTSPNPMPGVQLWAFDLDPNVPGLQFGFGGACNADSLSRLQMYSVIAGGQIWERVAAALHHGTGELPSVVLDLDGDPDNGLQDLLSSVRRGAGKALRGSLELQVLDLIAHEYLGSTTTKAPLPDTLFYSAPVVGDLDRDGRPDVVVAASNLTGVDNWDSRRVSFIYALALSRNALGEPEMTILPGWPRRMEDENGLALVSGDDAISLADVDGNGYPEILVLGTNEVLCVLNYHGESLVSLPLQLNAELRYFVEPQLAPLVADLTGDGRPELVLPLRDGQVFAVNPDGTRLGTWNYFGGGATRSSPAVADLDGDGRIELVAAADYQGGGRVMARSIGTGSGSPAWGMIRRSGAHDGTLPAEGQVPVDNGPALADVFMMPNPAHSGARFHYRVGAGATGVTLDIIDLLGRGVRRFEGTAFAGSDNTVAWDLKGADGTLVAPGVYLARIEVRAGGVTTRRTIKVAVLR